MINYKKKILIALAAAFITKAAYALDLTSADDKTPSDTNSVVDKANNPLTPLNSIALQNFVQTGLNGANSNPGDNLNIKFVKHIPVNTLIPVPQLLRIQLPVNVVPLPNGGSTGGLGGLSLFDIFLLKQTGLEFGIGPSLTLPTSTNAPWTGGNQTEAGVSMMSTYHKPRYLVGAVVQAQSSFHWSQGEPTAGFITLQPITSFTIADGWYLRSSGMWNFNFIPGYNNYYIPLGLGLGKAWRSHGMIFNMYAEPQPTIIHGGLGAPKFQFLTGLTMMFNG